MDLVPGWMDLQFVENPGMAFGWMIPGNGGKLLLSIFRLIVVAVIFWYLFKLIKQKVHSGYIICVSLIVAGALGNIIDSALYGLIFDKGAVYNQDINDYIMYHGVAQFSGNGYAPPLLGNVVDMFHFTKTVHYPAWFPLWGGQTREIFPPVFNVADSAITIGIIFILLWQRTFFPKKEEAIAVAKSSPDNENDHQKETPEDFVATSAGVE